MSRPARSVVARGVYNAATDGVRFAAWGQGGTPGALVVRDEGTGRTQRFDLGRACSYVSVMAGAQGLFLVSCRAGPSTWMVVNVKSGQITPIGDEHTDECEAFGQIGRYWLEGASPCTKGTSFYRNWHTGEDLGQGAPEGELRQPYDLDTTSLQRLGPPRRVFVVGSSRVLSRVRTGRKHPLYAIELRGPGSRTRRFRCSGPCAPSSIAAGLALWLDRDGSSLQGYALAKQRRLTWNMPVPAMVVGSTATRVYYTTPNRSNPSVLRDLKSFRWR